MVYGLQCDHKKKKKKGYHNSLRGKYCSGRIFSEEILEIVTVHLIIYCLIIVSSSLMLPSVEVIHDEFILHDEVIQQSLSNSQRC